MFQQVIPLQVTLFLLLAGFSKLGCAEQPNIDFNRDIRPILFGNCVTCHGPDEEERAAGLRLDTAEGATEDLGGYAAIVPGKVDASELVTRILTDDEDLRMPPPDHSKKLEQHQVDLLRRWIKQGAPYAKHWSYQIPVRPPLPNVIQTEWPNNAIDYFTLARMEQSSQHPSPPADRLSIARRVAIDLTGLPPTWDEAFEFAQDSREDAYEIYVDTMLHKPSFGERWARVWLDLARYADSAGYADDPPRTIWAYRDYVIRSLNENIPFDQFTIEQIAGDLLPDPNDQQLVATAFHRNTLTNNEGGTNDEEFRNVAIVDRVNTTMAVWMGTTMACAQCHTHKYDPITQEEYFRFFAFFNNTVDSDKRDEKPRFDLWSDAQTLRKNQVKKRIEALNKEIGLPSDQIDEERDKWISSFESPPSWSPAISGATSASRKFKTLDQNWITQVDPPETDRKPLPDKESLTITTQLDGNPATGIQLQVSAEQENNFVLSQIEATWIPQDRVEIQGKFVRVSLPGKSKILNLAEIEVLHSGTNLARQGKAKQSSTYNDAVASRAIDGDTNGDYKKKSVAHTQTENDPWIEVELAQTSNIDQIRVWNRTDGGQVVTNRLNGFEVTIFDADHQLIWTFSPRQSGKTHYELSPNGSRTITFQTAVADFEQTGFPASQVLTRTIKPDTGWAISPQTAKPHQLTLVAKTPLPSEPGQLELTIHQRSKYAKHLLTDFRVLTTSDVALTRWAKLDKTIQKILSQSREDWTNSDAKILDKYFRKIAPSLQKQNQELAGLEKELADMKPYTSVPIMRELDTKDRRETKLQIRGNYQSTAQTVTHGTPAVFHSVENESAPTRLDLAKWLVDNRNPLTPRVIVNRHWEQLFGIGIVETSEEFGSQGEPPSHPKLLDWLAVEFRESGWDVKQLLKLMVMSSTYRQSSAISPELALTDPDNRLLARGPRFRISAEMVRDQSLFVSGLMSHKQYGPPVKPPQPELGLKAAFGSATDWKTSQGEDRYRRGIYTTWRRSSPYPSMAQFDAPNREVCTVRRIRTNTPLQALVTLNDPVYIEAAQALARRMIESTDNPGQRLSYAFRRCLIRQPSAFELDRLQQLASEAEKTFQRDIEEAIKMATDPLGSLEEGANIAEYAAWTVVANVILNLDEMFLKR